MEYGGSASALVFLVCLQKVNINGGEDEIDIEMKFNLMGCENGNVHLRSFVRTYIVCDHV